MIICHHVEATGGRSADNQRQYSKDKSAVRNRYPESHSGESRRPEIQRERILRSARHNSSKIRNAAKGSHRKIFCNQCGERVRHLKAYILPSHGKLRREGLGWFGAQKAWPPCPPQTKSRDFGLSEPEPGARSTDACAALGIIGSAGIRFGCPSTVDRAGVGWKKNSTLNCLKTQEFLSESSIALSTYETLRRSALGEVLRPEFRSGLCLIVRQGMWRWSRDLASTALHQNSKKHYPTPLIEHAESPLIQAFASMVLHCNDRRHL